MSPDEQIISCEYVYSLDHLAAWVKCYVLEVSSDLDACFIARRIPESGWGCSWEALEHFSDFQVEPMPAGLEMPVNLEGDLAFVAASLEKAAENLRSSAE